MHTVVRRISTRLQLSPVMVLLAALSVFALVVGAGSASAAGGPGAGGGGGGAGGGVGAGGAGTAKPPPRTLAPFVEPNLADPTFSVAPAGIHGFTELGFLQHATVDGTGCPGTPPTNSTT